MKTGRSTHRIHDIITLRHYCGETKFAGIKSPRSLRLIVQVGKVPTGHVVRQKAARGAWATSGLLELQGGV